MYGEGKTCEGPPTSQEWMMAVRADRVEGRKRVNAALATLVAEADKRGIGDSTKKAAVGFCFGGGNVLELARSGADVNAVVCLHGDLADHHAGQGGRHQSRGVRDPRLEGSGGAEGRPRRARSRDGRRRRQLADARLRRPAALLRRGGDDDEGHGRVQRRPPRTRPSGCSTTSSRTRSTRSSDNVNSAIAARRALFKRGRAALYFA